VLYKLYEINRALLGPATQLARAGVSMFSGPGSWLAQLPGAPGVAAGYELLYRLGKTYDKPEFGITEVTAHDTKVAVIEQTVLHKPFCRLRAFRRHSDRAEVVATLARDPVVLLVAPLSGHHATLLRDTVRTLASAHQVYVTDWTDARGVHVEHGAFSLDDYIGYLREFIGHLGAAQLHVVAVCQAAVPALAALALGAAAGEPQPLTLTLMGGPIDTRLSPTQVNQFATSRPLSWFERHLLHDVPVGYEGQGRRVYPGFLQHASFIAMNPIRHASSHWEFYQDLARGAHHEAEQHRRFYDEYNAVLDMAAEYYLDCVRIVFQEHLLPRGGWRVGDQPVTPAAITGTSLLTIEGEMDDISGLGQTAAAHELCTGIPAARKHHLTVEGAGHYGIFSGRRWRETIYPKVRDLIAGTRKRPPSRSRRAA
jgi:poly(3-hydroxybutyrate) depolymerase